MASQEPKLNLPVYVPLHLGVREHLKEGKMPRAAFATYCFLLTESNHETGVCKANAASIAAGFGSENGYGTQSAKTVKASIWSDLQRLLDICWINFEATAGSHQKFEILIHKYYVRGGKFKGRILDAFAPGALQKRTYVRDIDDLNENRALVEDSQSTSGGVIEHSWSTRGGQLEESRSTSGGDGLLYSSGDSLVGDTGETFLLFCGMPDTQWQSRVAKI